jgi:hypothetical protein
MQITKLYIENDAIYGDGEHLGCDFPKMITIPFAGDYNDLVHMIVSKEALTDIVKMISASLN